MPRKTAAPAQGALGPSALAPMARRKRRSTKPVTPLDIFTRIMQGDESITDRQFDAAKVAAPYMHPKLSGLATDALPRRSADAFTDEELAALAQENGVHPQA